MEALNMTMITKEDLIQKYKEFKEKNNEIPSVKEFCKYAGIHRRKLEQIYGDNAYSKFQIECGDIANKLNLVRTPREKIMRQYGDLALELGKLPLQSNWIHKGLRPTLEGIAKPPHSIKWSDFPAKFKEWVETKHINGYSKVLEYIDNLNSKTISKVNKSNLEFEKLINDVRMWSPARRRNNEEGYKVELRKHLESIGYLLDEEFGESNFDLLINKKYAIEIKKDPNLSDYDRLFGQLARHLEYKSNIIALLMDTPSEDKFRDFTLIVDKYFNVDDKSVEVIKK